MAKISDLTPDKANANKGTPRGLKALDASLRQYGAGRSILLDRDNRIIAGNKTAERAMDIGLDDVQIVDSDGTKLIAVRRTDLDLEDDGGKARALATYDNRVGQLDLDWDLDALGILDAEVLGELWSDKELADLGVNLGEPPEDPGAQIDKADELRQKWGVETGQLWKLGEHRLICGDCTDKGVVDAVMQGKRAQLIYTDPPYGVDYDGGTKVREKLEGDTTTDLYMPACRMSADYSDDKAALYLWHAGVKGIAAAAAAAAAAAGYEIRCEIVWNKNQAQYGALSAQYKQKHEPLYYCYKQGHAPYWYGPTNEITVWDCNRSSVNEYHPTQKPVELAERAMNNSSLANDIVTDFFLGSGATLIACERLGRKCRAVEISPAYVAVAIQRWVDMTGGIPELLHT